MRLDSRSSSWWDALLAIGILLSLETQLRLKASAVGPGELCLILWGLPVALSMTLRPSFVTPLAFWRMLRFWVLLALALSIGAMAAIVMGDIHDSYLVWHDVLAYFLLAPTTLLMVQSPRAGARLLRVERLIVLFGTSSLCVQAANIFGLFSLPGIDPWYWDRARGWGDNPEQLALLCLLLAGLGLHLAEIGANRRFRLLGVTCMAVAIPIGWMAKSNSFTIVMAAGAILFLGVKTARWLAENERRGRSRGLVLGFVLMIVPLGAGVVAGATAIVRQNIAANLFRDPGAETQSDFDLRLFLWVQAVNRGADSWMLGLGPGPHLAIPGSILNGRRGVNQPINLEHPQAGIAPNFESHNSILELFVQGGILAVANFLWLGGLCLSRSWRTRQDSLTVLMIALLAFGSFQVITRHPCVWFVLSLALLSARTPKSSWTRHAACEPGTWARPQPAPVVC